MSKPPSPPTTGWVNVEKGAVLPGNTLKIPMPAVRPPASNPSAPPKKP